MRLAVYGLHRGSSTEPDVLARRALLAEEVGIDDLWVGDHIALPVEDDGDPPDQPRLEAVVTLAYIAAVTSRIGLGIGVIVLPQRQPVLLAKQLASLDVLSRGRLTIGIGVGYVEPELTALGASLADRAARTDEYLAAMRVLWDQPVPSFTGEFVSFTGVVQRPRPVQRPHPPLLIGGHSPNALRRAVQVGKGWYGWNLDVDGAAEMIAAVREAGTRHPRPAELGELEISITPRGTPDLDTARRYADLGVHRLVIQPRTMNGSAMDELITSVGETLVGRV